MQEKSIKKLLERRWYIQGLNASPAFIHAAEMSGIKYLNKNFGFGYTGFFQIFKNDYDEIGYDIDDMEFLAEKIIKIYFKERKYLKKLTSFSEKDAVQFYQYLKIILKNKNYIINLSDRDLIDEYKIFAQYFYQSLATAHLIEPISLTTDTKLKEQIKNQIGEKSQKVFYKYFASLTESVFPSYFNEYNLEIKNFISIINRNKNLSNIFKGKSAEHIKNCIKELEIKNLFNRHLKKYFWIETTWKEGVYYTIDDLIKILQKIIKGEDKISAYNKNYFIKNLKIKNKLIEKLNLQTETVKLIRLLDFAAKWQDDRKKRIVTGVWTLDKFVFEIAKRFNVRQENLRYLLPEEMSLKLLRNKNLNKELAKRRRCCIYLFYKNESEILTGEKAKEFIRQLKSKNKTDDKSINGITASLGKVVGKVKICLTIKDIANFQEGEILITSMTRPEFLPAMKKAIAIITDEGGLTCHAAIISRELKKPCIIGTKCATKVLKDGDVVEVNANHGLARVIK